MNRMNDITNQEANALLEKYYEGETSTAEEQLLRHFLSQQDLPEYFDADKAIFGYFSVRKQKPKAAIGTFLKWVAIAAVFTGLVLVSKDLLNGKATCYTYINGTKITETEVVRQQALSSLEALSESGNEIETCSQKLNEGDLVQSQLQAFLKD